MALSSTSVNMVDPRDLLEMLRQHPLTTPFKLSLYSEQYGRQGILAAMRAVCSPVEGTMLCTMACYQSWEDCLSRALLANQPVVSCCPEGFLFFAIPLPGGKDIQDCLIGGGVFEKGPETNLDKVNSASAVQETAVKTSEHLPKPVSRSEAESIAEELSRSLPRLIEQKAHALSLSRTSQKLEAVRQLTRDINGCEDGEQALAIVSEALVVLFNLPRILIVLQKPGGSLVIHSALGLEADAIQFDQKAFADYFTETAGLPDSPSEEMLTRFFPDLEGHSAYFFPMGENPRPCGAIAILDVELHGRDQALIELLVNRLGIRLERLRSASEHHRERQFSARLLSMISSLSLIDCRHDLYRQILEMAAELLTASSGSLMLLDGADGTLKIAAAKGMSAALARTLSLSCGEGIAGRVATSGFPLLVNDIEQDSRVAAKNRPRFKTKSFVSLPLQLEKRLIGVLNLADKSNGTSFTEADLNLVQTFTNHAVLMIERAAVLEKAGQFEHLAITDPLTGLYNRRFMEDRLQQEFSRSERHQQNFCIILIDLDNFKIYNDVCGHLAGDNVLREVSTLLRRSAREMDIVTRYGGEEFCLILPETGKKESAFVGERIRRAIEAASFPRENHLPLGRLTASIGIAAFPADGSTVNELIHAADLALYRAKAMGRNRLVSYESSLENQALLSQHN